MRRARDGRESPGLCGRPFFIPPVLALPALSALFALCVPPAPVGRPYSRKRPPGD